MSETNYPDYVRQMLARAAAVLTDEKGGPADAAALCFEVLALFPAHQEAAELVLQIFHDSALIRDMRRAIGRHIDEWDDRPWQERRRLALSFRFLSHWEGKYELPVEVEELWPQDVRAIAREAHDQLLQDYLLGQERGAELAWVIFNEAIEQTADLRQMLLAAGFTYADHGYFAEAADLLRQLLAHYPQEQAGRRLWAEVCWWRDHRQQLPWIPPEGDGSAQRYRRMLLRLDPEAAADMEHATSPIEHIPPDPARLPADLQLPHPLAPDLVDEISDALGNPAPTEKTGPVDWRYLDVLETGEVDVSALPEWAQYLLRELDTPEQETLVLQMILSRLANPGLDEEEE